MPNTHAFDPTDPINGFPFSHKETVSTGLLAVLAIVLPAALVFALTILLPYAAPHSRFSRSSLRTYTQSATWKRRLYALNTAWLGLALAIALALLITDGLKNFIGKPRPDMLERCGVTRESIAAAATGPAGLVTWDACTNRFNNGAGGFTESDVRDGFRSWPSGHSSTSFAGLGYLCVFLGKYVFGLRLPHLTTMQQDRSPVSPASQHADEGTPSAASSSSAAAAAGKHSPSSAENTEVESVLPSFPTMLALLLCAVPPLLAAFIASSRYSDYRHHGFDILSGCVVGLFSAYAGWRWYGAWSCVEQVRPRRIGAAGGAKTSAEHGHGLFGRDSGMDDDGVHFEPKHSRDPEPESEIV